MQAREIPWILHKSMPDMRPNWLNGMKMKSGVFLKRKSIYYLRIFFLSVHMKNLFAFFNRPKVRFFCTWLGLTWTRFCIWFVVIWWLDNCNVVQFFGMCLFTLSEVFVSIPVHKNLKMSSKVDYWFTFISYTTALVSSGIVYCYILT